VDIEESEMPEAIRLDPKLSKEWFPELTLKVNSEERYFED